MTNATISRVESTPAIAFLPQMIVNDGPGCVDAYRTRVEIVSAGPNFARVRNARGTELVVPSRWLNNSQPINRHNDASDMAEYMSDDDEG